LTAAADDTIGGTGQRYSPLGGGSIYWLCRDRTSGVAGHPSRRMLGVEAWFVHKKSQPSLQLCREAICSRRDDHHCDQISDSVRRLFIELGRPNVQGAPFEFFPLSLTWWRMKKLPIALGVIRMPRWSAALRHFFCVGREIGAFNSARLSKRCRRALPAPRARVSHRGQPLDIAYRCSRAIPCSGPNAGASADYGR
jgi:hypothetical protein